MFDDPRKELAELEKQLLEDEEWFQRELDSAKRMIGQMPEKPQRPTAPRKTQATKVTQSAPVRNYANGYGQGQPKAAPRKPQAEAPAKKEKGIKGLVTLAIFETLGILGLAAYWVLYLLK